VTDQDAGWRTVSQEARREALIAFLWAGVPDGPWIALAVDSLATARRAVATYCQHSEPVDDWLTSEVQLRGIRENAAVPAVLEVPQWRDQATAIYKRQHPDRTGALAALLAVLDNEPVASG
jgi:hypothetical protein